MLKSFFKDSSLYFLATLFTKGLGFIMLPIYTRNLSLVEYGIFDYLISIGSIVSIIATLEITQGIMRYVSEGQRDEKLLKTYVSTSVWFTLLVYGAVVAVFSFLSEEIAFLLFDDVGKKNLIQIASLYFFSNAVVYLFNVIFRAQLKAKIAVLSSLMSAVLVAGFSLFALTILKSGIEGVFYAQFLASLIIILFSMIHQNQYLSFTFDGQVLKQLLAFSLPLVPSSLSILVSVNADRLMIKELLNIESVAVYGVGARVASVVLLLIIGFQSALTPLIYRHYKAQNTPNEIAKLLYVYLGLTVGSVLFLSLFSSTVLKLVAGEQYILAATVIPILAFASFISSMYLFFPGLSLYKKTATIAKVSIISALLNLPLNYILIQNFGIFGAAISTLISAVFGCLVLIYKSQRYYFIPLNKLYISLYLSCVTATFLCLS